MERLIIFGILSLPLIIISRRTLFNTKSHGLYRFISWECILWLLVSNFNYWFIDPLSLNQIFSWIFLFFSGYLIIAGVILLRRKGSPGNNRENDNLYRFERTNELVVTGIFKYIRHPLYSSLLFLTWGIFLKNTSIELLIITMLSTAFLFLTAIFDEKECIKFFGEKYQEYMKRSKRFIPFII